MNGAGPEPATVLTVENLCVDYRHIRAVQGVALAVRQGVTAILGSNGAGKSSLVKAVAGLEKPAAGAVRLAGGRDITGLAAHRRVIDLGIVLVPEGRGTLPRMTVRENLGFGFRVGARRARRARGSGVPPMALADLLALFPALERRLTVPARYLSGGEQQMLSIARALAMDPAVLLVDEPSLGLSPAMVSTVFAAIGRVAAQRRLALVLIEQDPLRALALSDYAYVMERGRVELEGPADRIAADSGLRTAYLGRAGKPREEQ